MLLLLLCFVSISIFYSFFPSPLTHYLCLVTQSSVSHFSSSFISFFQKFSSPFFAKIMKISKDFPLFHNYDSILEVIFHFSTKMVNQLFENFTISLLLRRKKITTKFSWLFSFVIFLFFSLENSSRFLN